MLRTPLKTTLFALLFCSPLSIADGMLVPQRELPPPAAASPRVQAAIAKSPSFDAGRRPPVPATEEQWYNLINERAALPPDFLESFSQQLGLSIVRDTIAGVAVHHVTPAQVAADNRGKLVVYLHGGAYVFGGGDASVREAALISALSGIPALSIDYRMPPEYPFPAAVHDVENVYRQLLREYDSGAIALGGTSAGGGLTLAALHHFKEQKLALPAAIFLGTPWADLSKTSDTLFTNEGVDRSLGTYDGLLQACALLYAGKEELTHPLVSPVYGDFSGFPPAYLVSGTRDMLLSDTVRVHRKLRVAGVRADLNVYEGLSHAEYAMVGGSPEWQQVYGELKDFLWEHLSPTQ